MVNDTNLAPLATALPDLRSDGTFTEDNWTTLLSIMDTAVPSITSRVTSSELHQLSIPDTEYATTIDFLKRSAADSTVVDAYLSERPSQNPRFVSLLKRSLNDFAKADARKGLGFILSALNTRVGCLLLTGYQTPFHEQPLHIRQSILEAWRVSFLPILNGLHAQLPRMAKSLWIKTSPTFQKLNGYPEFPAHYKPGKHYEYEFLQFAAAEEPEIVDTDVVIVGSGCGGGVCAKNLAEAGYRVLVVDKGYYFPPSQLPMNEEAGQVHLFENGGAEAVVDGSLNVTAGSSWGGGGTVNWSASLQTQGYVRKEWAQDRGLTFFESGEFQACLDSVCKRMGVSADHIKHNHGNQVLLEGSRKLGYHAKAVPQNSGGAAHDCGHCTLGCGSAEKQGPVVSWLADAAKAGAKFIEGLHTSHVIFDESSGIKKAVGVKAKWTSRNASGGVQGPASHVREVVITAKTVIISAGTLWSPIILMNSGLRNSQIGRNLYLHPVNFVVGIFPHTVKPWEGGILTSVCSSFENLDTHGHGVKLEATSMLPSFFLPIMPFTSGLNWKLQAAKYARMNGYIAIARDRDTGRVLKGEDGKPSLEYSPSGFDRAHIMQGVLALCRILYVQGAEEIIPCISGVEPFISPASTSSEPSITDSTFQKWLAQVEAHGNKAPQASFASAHQMGSNRMSVREKDGVVDPKGRVWGTEGLYVADASIFPSASGVNPMITNMALSEWVARGVVRDLGKRGGNGVGVAARL